MRKRGSQVLHILVCVSLILIFGLTIGCGEKQVPVPAEVTFGQLFANPNKYTGKQVNIEGFYYHGFETIVLSERLDYSGYAEGHLVPKGSMIWIEGGIPKEVYDM